MSDPREENKNPYFQELTLNLQHKGLTVGPEEDGLLPVNLDGRRLCLALDTGGVMYWMEDVSGDSRSVSAWVTSTSAAGSRVRFSNTPAFTVTIKGRAYTDRAARL